MPVLPDPGTCRDPRSGPNVGHIRDLRAVSEHGDIDALAGLRWAFFVEEHADEALEEDWTDFLTRFRQFADAALQSGRWFVWVADDGSRLQANIWIYLIPKVPRPSREARQFGYVANVFAAHDVRGGGIGTELLRAVKAWATAKQLEMLIVWPSERSGAYYERQGFLPSTEMLECELIGYQV